MIILLGTHVNGCEGKKNIYFEPVEYTVGMFLPYS